MMGLLLLYTLLLLYCYYYIIHGEKWILQLRDEIDV